MNAQSTTPPPSAYELKSPDYDLARIRRSMRSTLFTLWLTVAGKELKPSPLMKFGHEPKVGRLSEAECGEPEQWFFIGDLHGDFFALHTLLRAAMERRSDCRIMFLGDIVDRGEYPLETMFLLLEWGLYHPQRLAWIAGNHDVAFARGPSNLFVSQVSPAEFLSTLNTNDEMQSFRHWLGDFFVQLTKKLPRALLFPDGLLATHGGFPLTDRHADGAAAASETDYMNWLGSDGCLEDFTWTRIHRAPKKLPDRHSRGSQYGFKDFEAFCSLKPEYFPVKRMITGHEHPAGGHLVHASYAINPAMTLVGLGFDEMRQSKTERYRQYRDTLSIAQGRRDELPEVIAIPIDRSELQLMLPDLDIEAPPELTERIEE
jgi:hypothetical protein